MSPSPSPHTEGSPNDLLLVYLTHPGESKARKLARILLEKKLIACANIFPQGTSLYTWEGKICEEREWVSILKTDRARFPKLQELIKSLHPYDCPCILALPIAKAYGPYGDWLRSCLS
ncbi:MAG: divalent-cation tolerance protein CutA [Bacteriovoracales bacterium]|nr:divalent-cation tolerance protein CutA [Bacteriovoracales bacterium]